MDDDPNLTSGGHQRGALHPIAHLRFRARFSDGTCIEFSPVGETRKVFRAELKRRQRMGLSVNGVIEVLV